MKELNLIEDLSNLTQIPLDLMQKLCKISEKDICNIVYEEFIYSNKSIIDIDIGIGHLKLDLENDEGFIEYSFEPSDRLEKLLVKTINEKQSPLLNDIEKRLKNRVLSLFKELV